MVTLLDYGAGNVRSIRNAIKKHGYPIKDVYGPEDILNADKLIFPGVGSFGSAMQRLSELGLVEPLREYIRAGRPFLGICLGLQTLFEGSEESPHIPGLGIINGKVRRFDEGSLSIPMIGWNGINIKKGSTLFEGYKGEKLYFVHSYRAVPEENNSEWILTTTDYGGEFISGVQKGNVAAVQFHPEKSGAPGLRILKNFLGSENLTKPSSHTSSSEGTKMAKRIIACLDVRTNDEGDLVVTKGDRYDVREKGQVRNLGKPVELARRYFEEGADEIAFLNITGFRDFPLKDQPMLEVLKQTSKQVFVPLTIGGGIREYTDADGVYYSALDVASEYFRSGADKISIGSDAVYTVEEYLRTGEKTGKSSIEQISRVYGNQAVVVSIDPRRVYVNSPDDTHHHTIKTGLVGPNGEEHCWYQCTVKGGREGRDVDALQLATVCERLGAGEILLNCMDRDGTNLGYDIELIKHVKSAVNIPIIASSGAGRVEHFYEVFSETGVEAALAAGIFHRKEVPIQDVKDYLKARGLEIR
ncbi:MAG: imidazole glycerol phosphate synthase subunit HisF [Halobacteriota archaeon]